MAEPGWDWAEHHTGLKQHCRIFMFSIETKNISKAYKDVKALKNINLNVKEGEIFGLIGPDGAGKTTLFRILTTLILPDKGRAFVKGYDVVKKYKKIRKIVGYMPGKFSLYQDLSVEENLNFFASIFNTTVSENYETIKDIYSQLEPFKKRLAGRLSGGMKQKLALSCALVHKPEILFLDEPTTGVDAVSRKEFWDILNKIKNTGISIFVSTPYMEEAGLCDRVAFIQKGEILTVDTPKNIKSNFHDTLAAVKADNMYKLITDLRALKAVQAVFRFGKSIHLSFDINVINPDEILSYLKSKEHNNISIKKIDPNMEDCFMKLMKD